MKPDTPSPRDPTPHDLVIDTNVVLDWLAFGNPIGESITAALASGRWRWISTRAMREEMTHVIGRESLARWAIDADRLWATWNAWTVELDPPGPLGAHEQLKCTDTDDQPFIDLAIGKRAQALLTRDRAVLRLAGRAHRLGVMIATPERWLLSHGPAR